MKDNQGSGRLGHTQLEKYIVNNAKTERYMKSAIPSMQRLLNQSEREKSEIMKRINNYCPSEL